jgi:hypothetical protein
LSKLWRTATFPIWYAAVSASMNGPKSVKRCCRYARPRARWRAQSGGAG